MSWVKLDDQFPSHPKMVLAGGDAAWLHVCALCYCAQHLTDGRFPKAIVIRLSDRKKPDLLADKLVQVGAWIDHGDEYEIHGFLEFNRSREDVLREREAAKRRRAEGGKKSAERRANVARTSADARANDSNPDPTRPIEELIPAAAAADPYETDFDDWYSGYPRKRERAAARKAYTARRRAGTSHSDLIAARDHYVASLAGVELEHVKYPASFLNGKDGPWSEWVSGAPETSRVLAPAGKFSQPETPTRERDGVIERFYAGSGWIGQEWR